ncbi:putative ribosomal protein L6 [Rosa chinensis]|uniref:Putative ribosomal protein L6 n=1 Tax=Rosa chinensis TaxID=74649 RepID=A0A2P6RFS1_ROSCH|nr:putative ribosomal protein L6 [Rosa chinensis]
MRTPLVYHSAPSIPTFQSPLVSTFVPQLQFTDPKPLPLHSKQFRGFRCRVVVMGAKARVAKKTQNPDLLRYVGKYSRSKRYRRCSLWAIKAKSGGAFPRHNSKAAVEIMEAPLQQLVGLKTPVDISESPAVQFGTLLSSGNTSSSSVPATEATDHSTPTQAPIASPKVAQKVFDLKLAMEIPTPTAEDDEINKVGYVTIPVEIAGPLMLDGRELSVPMATTKSCRMEDPAKRLAGLKFFMEDPDKYETSFHLKKAKKMAKIT